MQGILFRDASGCLPQGMGKIKKMVFIFETLMLPPDWRRLGRYLEKQAPPHLIDNFPLTIWPEYGFRLI